MDDFDFDFDIEPEPTKPKRSRPPGKPKNPQSASININTSNIYIEGMNKQNIDIELSSARSLKEELTDKELKFIGIYLIGNLSKINAMRSAGYNGFSEDYTRVLARKIIQKYETRAGDHRIIARAIGAGEVTILRGLLDLAQNARSEQVRRAAWADLASCLGMKSEVIESFQGVSLNVYGMDEARRLGIQVGPAGQEPSDLPKTIQITK